MNRQKVSPRASAARAALGSLLAACLFASLAPGRASARAEPPAAKPTPAAPDTTGIPAIPAPPANLPFADEIKGRRLLFAAYDAVRNAPSFAFAAKVSTYQYDARRARPATPTVTRETGRAEPRAGRYALTAEAEAGRGKRLQRAIVTEEAALVTRYEEAGDGKTAPTREFSRLSLDPLTPAYRALPALRYGPESLAGRWLVSEGSPLLRFGTLYWDGAAVVEYARDANPRRGTEALFVRRYQLDPATGRVAKYEEWARTLDPTAGRKPSARLTYRAEEYAEWATGKATLPPATFDQSLPATYREKEPPRRPDPLPVPQNADPKALALIARWEQARQRWLTYAATVELTVRQTPRTAESRPVPEAWRNASVRFGVQAKQHGKTKISQAWLTGGDPRDTPRNALYVSDGAQLRFTDQDRNRTQTRQLDTPDDLWRQLNRTDLEEYGGLAWIYAGVPRVATFTRLGYGGTTTTPDGETVEVVLLEYRDSYRDRRGRLLDVENVTRVGLGADGLPRVLEQTRKASVNGGFERDNPPVSQVTAYYRNVRLDGELASNAFTLPALPSK